jgi:hypothetical protein
VLKRIFGPKTADAAGVAGIWRRLHNEELHNLYHSPNIIRIIKPKSTEWAGHVASMYEMKMAYKI